MMEGSTQPELNVEDGEGELNATISEENENQGDDNADDISLDGSSMIESTQPELNIEDREAELNATISEENENQGDDNADDSSLEPATAPPSPSSASPISSSSSTDGSSVIDSTQPELNIEDREGELNAMIPKEDENQDDENIFLQPATAPPPPSEASLTSSSSNTGSDFADMAMAAVRERVSQCRDSIKETATRIEQHNAAELRSLRQRRQQRAEKRLINENKLKLAVKLREEFLEMENLKVKVMDLRLERRRELKCLVRWHENISSENKREDDGGENDDVTNEGREQPDELLTEEEPKADSDERNIEKLIAGVKASTLYELLDCGEDDLYDPNFVDVSLDPSIAIVEKTSITVPPTITELIDAIEGYNVRLLDIELMQSIILAENAALKGQDQFQIGTEGIIVGNDPNFSPTQPSKHEQRRAQFMSRFKNMSQSIRSKMSIRRQ